MTRINSAIDPKNLTDQHLIAELRESLRVFTLVDKRRDQIKISEIPKEFTLGTGHVRFWYDKLKFLDIRHCQLRTEYELRFSKIYQLVPNPIIDNFYNDYYSTQKEKQLLIDRISTRITESNQTPRYYGEKITKEQAINLLIFGTLSLVTVSPIRGFHRNFVTTNEGDKINSVLNNEYLKS